MLVLSLSMVLLLSLLKFKLFFFSGYVELSSILRICNDDRYSRIKHLQNIFVGACRSFHVFCLSRDSFSLFLDRNVKGASLNKMVWSQYVISLDICAADDCSM